MYPVKLLKDHYQLAGQQADVINEIVARNNLSGVYTFALNNLNNTKQHIYIYTNNRNFNEANFNPAIFPIPVIDHGRTPQGYHIRCMPAVDCSATIKDTVTGAYSDVVMRFPQPIVITITRTHIIIKATIIEKNVGSYIQGGNAESFNVRKNVEDDFTADIIAFFAAAHNVGVCDLNRGIKHLCDNDILDLRTMKILKNQSTATEVMNGDNTFKQCYPNDYAAAMRNPLSKSLFKYLPNDELLCKSFAADPNVGRLSITLYPSTPNQVQNVVSQILANN